MNSLSKKANITASALVLILSILSGGAIWYAADTMQSAQNIFLHRADTLSWHVSNLDRELLRLQLDFSRFILSPNPEDRAQLAKDLDMAHVRMDVLKGANKSPWEAESLALDDLESILNYIENILNNFDKKTAPVKALSLKRITDHSNYIHELTSTLLNNEMKVATELSNNLSDLNRIILYSMAIILMALIFIAVLLMKQIGMSKSLRESQVVLRTLSRAVEQSPSMLIITNLEGDIEYVNPKFSEVTGYASSEVIGVNSRILKSPNTPTSLHAELWKAIKSGRVWRGEIEDRRKDGSLFWVFASVSPIMDENGKITSYLAAQEDITARKDAEKEARLKRSLQREIAVKNRLFSIIAHDLRSPFNTLLGTTQMMTMMADKLSKEKVVEQAESLHEAAKNIFTLVENLLDWSLSQLGGEKFDPRQISIKTIVEDCFTALSLVAAKKGIALHHEVKEETAFADPNMVRTVIRNLVNNALKFTESGGTVEISVADLNTHMEVTVSDTGEGIDEAMLDKLFIVDEKTTTEGTSGESGSGLGLPLCHDLVKKQGGTIRVERNVERGSRFIFTLPKKRAPQEDMGSRTAGSR